MENSSWLEGDPVDLLVEAVVFLTLEILWYLPHSKWHLKTSDLYFPFFPSTSLYFLLHKLFAPLNTKLEVIHFQKKRLCNLDNFHFDISLSPKRSLTAPLTCLQTKTALLFLFFSESDTALGQGKSWASLLGIFQVLLYLNLFVIRIEWTCLFGLTTKNILQLNNTRIFSWKYCSMKSILIWIIQSYGYNLSLIQSQIHVIPKKCSINVPVDFDYLLKPALKITAGQWSLIIVKAFVTAEKPCCTVIITTTT